MSEIIRNLEKSLPQLVTKDMDLHDLITWVLLQEPGERPTINQVLSYAFIRIIELNNTVKITCVVLDTCSSGPMTRNGVFC